MNMSLQARSGFISGFVSSVIIISNNYMIQLIELHPLIYSKLKQDIKNTEKLFFVAIHLGETKPIFREWLIKERTFEIISPTKQLRAKPYYTKKKNKILP